MGETSYGLGVETIKNHSMKLILEHFRMHYSKPMATLAEKGLAISHDQSLEQIKKRRE